MGGDVDTGFVHARIYGQYSRLLKRKDYEILANRQSPGEGTAGFVFKSSEDITAGAREKIFKYEADHLYSIMHLNRDYKRITAAVMGLFEIENLKNAARRCSRGIKDVSPWYDTEPWNNFSRTCIEEAETPENLHREILQTRWKNSWPADVPENYFEWEKALEYLQLEIVRTGWGKYFYLTRQKTGSDLAALLGVSLLMKKIVRQFLTGSWEEGDFFSAVETKKYYGDKWYLLIREWSDKLLTDLRPDRNHDFYFDDEGIVAAEKSLHQAVWSYARGNLFSDFHSPVTAASYLLLWYYQVKNFLALSEGIRLGRKASKIMELVICGE